MPLFYVYTKFGSHHFEADEAHVDASGVLHLRMQERRKPSTTFLAFAPDVWKAYHIMNSYRVDDHGKHKLVRKDDIAPLVLGPKGRNNANRT